jgi:Flp pilus assembly pilin Flp
MLKRFAKNENGQALVEFALITPLLILLLCGIIDFGWIFGNQLILNNAGRDTARYMAINYNDSAITGSSLSDKDAAATTYLTDQLGPGSRKEFDVIPTLTGLAPNQKIEIYASYKLQVLTPVLSTIIGDSFIEIDTETTMRLE